MARKRGTARTGKTTRIKSGLTRLSPQWFERQVRRELDIKLPQDFVAIAPAGGDRVNHPPHYKASPSGVECIEVVRHMNFNRGNAVKYIWRAGEKDCSREIEDLQKARWYLDDEIARLRLAAASK